MNGKLMAIKREDGYYLVHIDAEHGPRYTNTGPRLWNDEKEIKNLVKHYPILWEKHLVVYFTIQQQETKSIKIQILMEK